MIVALSAARALDAYVGVPFKDGGRDFAGFDCWGLVRRLLEDEAKVIGLPDYGETPAAEFSAVARDIAGAEASPTWTKVDRRQGRCFDVVTMLGHQRIDGRLHNLVCHVGVLVDPAHVLHVEAVTDSAIVRLDHPSMRLRVAGFYRHRDLA